MVTSSSITLTHISGGCKYHRRCGDEFQLEELGPKGLCLHAYFTAYPYILGMLHNVQYDWMTENPDHVYAQCPALVTPRVIDVFREKNDADKLSVFVRIDSINDKVNVPGAKKCDCPHSGGETFEINQGDGEGFCPAAFNQLFPYLRSFINGGNSEFLPQGNEFIGVCPDNLNNVTFKVERKI